MKKLILPVLIMIALFSSCQKENVEYEMLVDEIAELEADLSSFILDAAIQIEDETNAYNLLLVSYEKRAEFYDSTAVLEAKLIALKDTINQEAYDSLDADIAALTVQTEQCTESVDEYYAEDVSNRVAAMLSDYALSPDSTQSINTYNNIMDEITSIEGEFALNNAKLQGQVILLNSFDICKNSYDEWIISSETFASDSLLSETRETSRALISAYLETTTVYYEAHMQALNAASSLDSSFHKNVEALNEIFSPYTAIYEKAIGNLKEALKY